MTPEERTQYRAIGGRLAVVLRQRQGQLPSPAAMQGIAADLVGDKTELLLPLKDLVSRPGFQSLISQAGSGRGTAERQALLAELEATFASTVIRAMGELLGGFLDLPATAAQVPVGNEARVNRAANSPDRPAPATPEAPTPPPTNAGGTTPSKRTSASPTQLRWFVRGRNRLRFPTPPCLLNSSSGMPRCAHIHHRRNVG